MFGAWMGILKGIYRSFHIKEIIYKHTHHGTAGLFVAQSTPPCKPSCFFFLFINGVQ